MFSLGNILMSKILGHIDDNDCHSPQWLVILLLTGDAESMEKFSRRLVWI